MMTLLWPDFPEDSARYSLRQALYHLREAIPELPARGKADGQTVPFLLSDRQTVQLNFVAAVIRVRRDLRLKSGLLVTIPVPDASAMDPQEAESAIEQATAEADGAGIFGPASTPWLLRRMVELTNGQSMRANIALLCNNSIIAAQIAVALTNHSTI